MYVITLTVVMVTSVLCVSLTVLIVTDVCYLDSFDGLRCIKLQATVSRIPLSTTAIFAYAIGLFNTVGRLTVLCRCSSGSMLVADNSDCIRPFCRSC